MSSNTPGDDKPGRRQEVRKSKLEESKQVTVKKKKKNKVMNQTRTVIEFIDFDLRLGRDHVLKQINLKLSKRMIVAIVGPSGSGKSTLIRALNRMNEFRDRVRVDGQVLFNKLSIYGRSLSTWALRSAIGMVFQKPSPFALTVYENVAYGLRRRYRLNHRQLKTVVNQALTDANLWEKFGDKQDTAALTLSGGEQQRLCIARAIALQPKVLLLDEPTSSLDPASRWKIESTIKSLSKKMMIILVTHDLEQTKRLADYVYFLKDGKIVEEGVTSNIFDRPQHEATRKFLLRYQA